MISSQVRAQLLDGYRQEVEERDMLEVHEEEQRYLLRACAGTLVRVLSDEMRHATELAQYSASLLLHAKLLDASASEGPRRLVILREYSRHALWLQYMWKRDLLIAQYEEHRRVAYVRMILFPNLLADAGLWFRLHRDLSKRLSRTDEPNERGMLKNLEEKARHAAAAAGQQAVIIGAEHDARADVQAFMFDEWKRVEAEHCRINEELSRHRSTSMLFQLYECQTISLLDLVADEASERQEGLLGYWAEVKLCEFIEMGNCSLGGALLQGRRAAVEWQLVRTSLVEEAQRLLLYVEESNVFNGEVDRLELSRRTEASRRIQRLTRRFLARSELLRQQHKVENLRTTGELAERAVYWQGRWAEMSSSFACTIEPFLSGALSARVVFSHLSTLARRVIGPVAEGYLDRKALGYDRSRTLRDRLIHHADALVRVVPLLQRVGRGFLIREEVFDVLVEEWEMQEAERQRRVTAGLVIWWAWREFRDVRKLRREQELRDERRNAVIKIQSLFRAAHCRDYYKLVMLPRHWVATTKRIQKVCRGFQARRGLRKMKSLRLIHTACRSYLSRFEVERRRLYPFARTIQCFWRSFLSRRLRNRRRTAWVLRSRTSFQDALVAPIQAAFRGYLQRKRAKIQLAISRALRKEKIEAIAVHLDDDLWRIGRAFIARRRVFTMLLTRWKMTLVAQCFANGASSLMVVDCLQRAYISKLKQQLEVARATVAQAFMRALTSSIFFDARRRQHAEYVARGEALHVILAPLVAGYSDRRKMSRLWTVVFKAAAKIQRLARRSAAMRTRSSLKLARLASMDQENRLGAAAVLTLHWRKLQDRRNWAAATIQRFYLSQALRLHRKREVAEARRGEKLLQIRSVVRAEVVERRLIEQTEIERAAFLKRTIRQAAAVMLPHVLTKIVVSPHFFVKEEHRRLRTEEAYVENLRNLSQMERASRLVAFERSVTAAFTNGSARVIRSEDVSRNRVARDELNTRRLIAVASLNRIGKLFDEKRTRVVLDEGKVRLKLVGMYEDELSVYTKRYTLWLVSTSHFDTHSILPEKEAASHGSATFAPPRGPLRPFQIPIDVMETKDCSPAEFDDIFAKALRHNRSATLSAPAAIGRTGQLPRLPQGLPKEPFHQATVPLDDMSILQSRALIPPRSTLGSDDQSFLEQHDQFMVTCAVRRMSLVSNDGVLDTSPLLGSSMTGDELAAPLVEFVADPLHPVRHLRCSGLTMSDKGFLRILRFAADHHSPLESIDLSHNLHITDISASHLALAIEKLESLVSIDVSATNVSVAKRQLLSHLLERKQHFSRLPTSAADGQQVVLRRPRPLQIPRRNGWTTTYKTHRLAPIPQIEKGLKPNQGLPEKQ